MMTCGGRYNMDFPTKKYSVIYADPPWNFKSWSKAGEGRNPNKHYPCMKLKDIKALPVQFCTADDCVLFMWATYPLLPQAFEVIDAWGFKYKTVAFTWVKENKVSDGLFMGGGYWTRSNAEICLLATRGKPKRLANNVRQVIVSKRQEHSRKPKEIYGRIERLVGGEKIELFARQQINGWDAWGNETDKFRETV